ncbi:hypothetical protein PF004_g23349 [Phytophthora fragariae]|uniref:Uncharacterized protein n=1 Tax=Phytophthora fragariae TaxID=53985 RepID=A0A6A3H4Q1_9STRA|nr:hypothetical protein PF003_g33139 [Phytophthora fragariae]KAE8964177.1 hypothetical protein PF011_g28764 [Phytophthora fragariae]KAE9185471.1 hypothetical protein PF004_g23349 [Phytophthora fragariae]
MDGDEDMGCDSTPEDATSYDIASRRATVAVAVGKQEEQCLTMEMIATAVAMQIVPATHRRATVRAVTSSGAAETPGGAAAAADATSAVAGGVLPSPDVRQELENEIDRAADDVVRAVIVQRVEAAELALVQFTDEDVKREHAKSVMVQTLKQKGTYRGRHRPCGSRRGREPDDHACKVLGVNIQRSPRQSMGRAVAWSADV